MRATAATAVLPFVWLLAGCAGEPEPPAPEIRPVRTHRVAPSEGAELRTLAGVARAGVESRLSFRVGGTVQQLRAALGDRVRAGHVLAVLDPADYELQVEEAEAALAQSQAGLRRAEADYDRVRALYENNNASKSELDAARAAAESAEAVVESGAKRLELARRQVDYTVLRAPSDGAIAMVTVEVNENVRSGQEVVLLVIGSHPEVQVAVPEVLIPRVYAGQPVTVELAALGGRRLDGVVSEVGVAMTGTASTFTVTVRLVDAHPAIRSGMAADVTFRLVDENASERLLVPPVAVGEDRHGRYVFVVRQLDDGTARVERRGVTVAASGGVGGIEIVDGLEAGELIVTAGLRRMSEGMRVRPVDAGEPM